MSAEPPLAILVTLIVVSVLIFGSLAVGAMLVIRDAIRQRGKWGINLKQAVCTQCGTPMPMVRRPANWRQALWGGGTCPECGFELDKWGRPFEEQNTLAKWATLRAVEEIEERQQQRHSDDRIQATKDQMQLGDAS